MKQRWQPWVIGSVAAAICSVLLLWNEGGIAASPGGNAWADPKVDRDLAPIKTDTLRVLVIDHHLTYEQWPQAETGLEYELLERFARREGVTCKAVLVERPDSLLPMLQRGDGDVIAAQLGLDNTFRGAIAHSSPYRFVAPVFATLRADRLLGVRNDDRRDGPDTAWVAAWSPFAPAERRFPGSDAKVDPKQRTVFTDTSRSVDDAVINVVLGRTRAVIISDAEAVHLARRFPQLAFSGTMGESVPLVFGLRRNAHRLREAMNEWLADPDEREALSMIMSAYGTQIPKRGAMGRLRNALAGDTLSPYDSLFQRRGGQLAWDWELLAAIAFKESRFDSTAVSDRGAQGLMQMMPRTAEGMGEDSLHLVDEQIRAAARYLATLDSIWMRSIPNTDQRLRFVLAAYNAGPGHVLDAQHLAGSLGLDPRRWEGNVERAITLLSVPHFFSRPDMNSGPCQGSQTFIYVREVTGLYEQFRSGPPTAAN